MIVNIDMEKLREYVNEILSEEEGEPLTEKELVMCAHCIKDSVDFDVMWETLEEDRETISG